MRRMEATYHLDELAVLNHHSVDDSEEGLVGREQASAPCEGVSLHHTLASVLRENLDDTSTAVASCDIPLEVTSCGFEDSVELVRYQLVVREDTELLGVPGGWTYKREIILKE